MKKLMLLLSLIFATATFAQNDDIQIPKRTKYWYFGISEIPYNANLPSINIGFHQDIQDTVFFVEPSIDLITITDEYLGFRLSLDGNAVYSKNDLDYYAGIGLKYEYLDIQTKEKNEYFSYIAPSVNVGLIYHRNRINPIRLELNMICPSYYISSSNVGKNPQFGGKWTIGF